jgi:hypothetical protein
MLGARRPSKPRFMARPRKPLASEKNGSWLTVGSYLVPERSCAVDTKLTTEGHFYECNQYFHRSAYRFVHDSTPPLDA